MSDSRRPSEWAKVGFLLAIGAAAALVPAIALGVILGLEGHSALIVMRAEKEAARVKAELERAERHRRAAEANPELDRTAAEQRERQSWLERQREEDQRLSRPCAWCGHTGHLHDVGGCLSVECFCRAYGEGPASPEKIAEMKAEFVRLDAERRAEWWNLERERKAAKAQPRQDAERERLEKLARKCERCKHAAGDHAYLAPFKCLERDCGCPAFSEEVAAGGTNPAPR